MTKGIIEDNGFSWGHKPEKPFKLHQIYEPEGSVGQIKCAKCGRTELEVGTGSHFTVIRCPDCGHESCIHDG